MSVAAIMPTYNQAEFLMEAIASVSPWVDKLIIVDDGSTDATDDLLKREVHITHAGNRGTATAINTGFHHVQSDWVTWVSSDNTYEPRWTQILLSHTSKDVGAVYSAFWYGSKDRVLYTPYDPKTLINQEECYFGPCFLIRREVWEEAGPHRGKISHDYDHWLRVEEACWRMGLRIVDVPEPLCLYRVHSKRVTVTRRHQYDAPHWQAEARKRRLTLAQGLPITAP